MSFWIFPGAGVDTDHEFTEDTADIKMDGAASVGIIDKIVRADHVHPSDTTKAPLNSPSLVTPDIGEATGTGLTLSGLTASKAVQTNASKKLITVDNTGTGKNVLDTAPTISSPAMTTPTADTLTGVADSLVLQGRADGDVPAFAYLRGNAGGNLGIRAGKYGQDYAGQNSTQYSIITTSTAIEVYTLEHIVVAKPGASNITVTLPLPENSYWGSAQTGRVLYIKKGDNGAGTVTIAATIDGVANRVLYFQDDYIRVISLGLSGWTLLDQSHAAVYGQIYVADGTTAQSIPTGTNYTKLTAFTAAGPSLNTTPSTANDNIVIIKPGVYSVSCSISTTVGTANTTWDFALFVNGVEADQAHTGRFFSSSSDVGALAVGGLVTVTTAGHAIDLRARHASGGTVTVTPQDMCMNARLVTA